MSEFEDELDLDEEVAADLRHVVHDVLVVKQRGTLVRFGNLLPERHLELNAVRFQRRRFGRIRKRRADTFRTVLPYMTY